MIPKDLFSSIGKKNISISKVDLDRIFNSLNEKSFGKIKLKEIAEAVSDRIDTVEDVETAILNKKFKTRYSGTDMLETLEIVFNGLKIVLVRDNNLDRFDIKVVRR